MKKVIFSTILSCFSLLTTAQVNLDTFYKQGTEWTEYKYASYGQGTGGYDAYKYRLGGDSSVNATNYHLLYTTSAGHCTLPWWNNPPVSCSHGANDGQYSLLGGIRVTGRQIMFINLTDSNYNTYPGGVSAQEKIAYDFNANLAVGDSIPWKSNPRIIQSIDSVQASNGMYLKRYHFQYFNNLYEDYWIEGIGSRLGFLGTYMSSIPTPQSYHALCYENSLFQYSIPDSVLPGNLDANCFNIDQYVKIRTLNIEQHEVSIYPNPTDNSTLYIEGDIKEIASIHLVNGMGQTLPVIQTSENSIQIPGTSGFYFLQLHFKDGSISMKKIIRK